MIVRHETTLTEAHTESVVSRLLNHEWLCHELIQLRTIHQGHSQQGTQSHAVAVGTHQLHICLIQTTSRENQSFSIDGLGRR